MPSRRDASWLTEEVAEFLASRPSREQLISYRPSTRAQERVRELLNRSKSGRITEEEQWELDQFEHAEMLLQMIKVRVRAEKVAQG